jgi:RNase P subunit RPR2
MGVWMYCRGCDKPLPPPWELSTKGLLHGLLHEIPCPYCGHENGYPEEEIIEYLAEKIEGKNECKRSS